MEGVTLIFMDIRAADADLLHLDQDFVVRDLRHRFLADLDLLRPCQNRVFREQTGVTPATFRQRYA